MPLCTVGPGFGQWPPVWKCVPLAGSSLRIGLHLRRMAFKASVVKQPGSLHLHAVDHGSVLQLCRDLAALTPLLQMGRSRHSHMDQHTLGLQRPGATSGSFPFSGACWPAGPWHRGVEIAMLVRMCAAMVRRCVRWPLLVNTAKIFVDECGDAAASAAAARHQRLCHSQLQQHSWLRGLLKAVRPVYRQAHLSAVVHGSMPPLLTVWIHAFKTGRG
mmetsp:Transcript_85592/g.169871  ORF Transcript_85592/g.169871 Transcript_85592/m.169871 type:complete len:216 (-) Transcript_85592:93-740(-)